MQRIMVRTNNDENGAVVITPHISSTKTDDGDHLVHPTEVVTVLIYPKEGYYIDSYVVISGSNEKIKTHIVQQKYSNASRDILEFTEFRFLMPMDDVVVNVIFNKYRVEVY